MLRTLHSVPAAALVLLAALATAAPLPPVIAGDGFGRPRRLDVLASGADAQVAVAAGRDGPAAVWEDTDGLMLLAPGPDVEATRLVRSHGIRAVAAGDAGGKALVAWVERDLETGRNRLSWRWRDETRVVRETGQRPLVRVVADAPRPELLVALPGRDGWRLSLHAWDGTVREMAPRPLTVAGLDAVRLDGAVALAWLEGSDEVTLGSVERDWRAYSALWPDGAERPEAPEPLGSALRAGSGDVVRLAVVEGEVHALWPGPDGRLRATGPGGAREGFGAGVPLGRLGGAWTWADGDRVVRLADGGTREVLRLPSAPERIEAADAAGTRVIVWSSGRYRGGLEVWAVDDVVPYRAGPIERLAGRMGWDPWRPWTAAGGHALLSMLVAVLLAAALTPLWWLGTASLGRRTGVSTSTAALEGAGVAVGSVLVLAAALAWRASLTADEIRALTGGPVLTTVAAAAGVVLAWLVLRHQDIEPGFGRLVGAWLAGGTMLLVVAFGTVQAWQDAFGPLA